MRPTGLIRSSSTLNSAATDHIVDWLIYRAIRSMDGMLFFPTFPITSDSKQMNTQVRKQLMPYAPALKNIIIEEMFYGWILLRWIEQKEKRLTKRTRNKEWVMESKPRLSVYQYLLQSQNSFTTLSMTSRNTTKICTM